MKNVQITIGHNVNGQPVHDTPAVCGMVSDVLGLEAFTAFECFGMWRGEAERSTRIEVCGLTDEEAARVRSMVPALAAELMQEAIMLEVRDDATEFIEPEHIAAAHVA